MAALISQSHIIALKQTRREWVVPLMASWAAARRLWTSPSAYLPNTLLCVRAYVDAHVRACEGALLPQWGRGSAAACQTRAEAFIGPQLGRHNR